MKNKHMLRANLCALIAVAMTILAVPGAQADGQVNVYSYRQPYLIKPLLEAFTKKTGIEAKVIFAKKGLSERIAAEGRNSPADILLTVDIGRLTGAVKAGITQPVSSHVLEQNIPAAYRDSAGQWFGLTRRGRVIYASRERVNQEQITYEELSEAKWRGKICIRSGQHVYNIALIAAMVAHHGEAKAAEWLTGLKGNLARKPAGNDRAQIKGVFSGECDIAVGNTYYMAKMQLNEKKPEQKEWAKSVRMVFPTIGGKGTHINLSGMVMAKHAPHKDAALKLMEFLSSAEAQKIYAEVNHEYPVKDGVAWSKLVQSWGTFEADDLALEDIAKLRKKASELVDKVAFNDGPSS